MNLEDNPNWAAWLAGIYEGEGTVCTHSKYGFYVRIKMTDRDVIQRIFDLWGGGNYYEEERKNPLHKKTYSWGIGDKKDVLRFLELIYYYLGERRRAKADEVIATIASKQKILDARIKHGTISGASAHKRRNQKLCEPCRKAYNTYHRERKRSIR